MGLFGKKKKNEENCGCDCGGACAPKPEPVKKAGCCCGGSCDAESMTKAEDAKAAGASVKVLGSGCAKCQQLEAAAKEALEQLGMDTAVDHITDFSQIAAYGVMTTPALVVDGKVVSLGKVLKTDELVQLLQKIR